MDRFNKQQLKGYFTYVPKENELKEQGVARLFVEAIFSGILPKGSAFPTQASLALHFDMPHTMVERIWKLLKVYHQVIKTRKGYGTSVVGVLPGEKIYRLREDLAFKVDSRKLTFDYESIHQHGYVNKSFDNAYHKITVHLRDLPSHERHTKWKSSFLRHCRNLVNNETDFSFTEEELYYGPNRYQIIYKMMRTLVSSDQVVLVMQPVQQKVKDTIREAKRKMIVLPSDSADFNLDQMEIECLKYVVGMVYIPLTILYHASGAVNINQKYRLHQLQEKYGFVIVFDDLHPLFTNFKGNDVWSENAKILYLRSVSMLTPATYETMVLAGKGDIMKKLKRALRGSTSISPELGFTLTNLLEYDKLAKFEMKEYKEAAAVSITIKKVFIESGLWQEGKLYSWPGWFFYLEPKHGTLPANIYHMLIKENIFVFDPAEFDADPMFSKGIFMSLSTRKSTTVIVRDINHFNDVIKTMIN